MGKRGLALAVLGAWLGACGSRSELYPGSLEQQGTGDAEPDATLDAGADATPDASVDAEPDAAPDASVDAEPDVPVPELVLDCPTSEDDPRLPYGFVGYEFVMNGADFVSGEVASWNWSVLPEKCDELLPQPRYQLIDADSQVTHFRPARPGSYGMVLTVTSPSGASQSCEFRVPVQGRGLRVELCWDTSTTTDLDLAVHNPFDNTPWYSPYQAPSALCGLYGATCNVLNCNPELRDIPSCGVVTERVAWGYPDSPLEFCDRYSSEIGFIDQGFCPNPRASTDNNNNRGIDETTGTAEVVQLDNPGDGDRFRIGVQNFSNEPAEPRVFVYCGREEATFLSPGTPPNFVAEGVHGSSVDYGVLWRPADVEMWVDGDGTTVGCLVEPLYLNGDPNQGPYVTINDPSY